MIRALRRHLVLDQNPVLITPLLIGRRFNILEHRTKGSPHMKHLDLYARRDPQLAPYLLREIDIEYKRKCRKVNFLVWVVLFVISVALQSRIQGESVHHLRNYASLVKLEEEAKDVDHQTRRRVIVEIMDVIVSAFNRDQTWTKKDTKKAEQVFEKYICD